MEYRFSKNGYFRSVLLTRISSLFSPPEEAAASSTFSVGYPAAVALSKSLIVVGTSTGLVLVFQYRATDEELCTDRHEGETDLLIFEEEEEQREKQKEKEEDAKTEVDGERDEEAGESVNVQYMQDLKLIIGNKNVLNTSSDFIAFRSVEKDEIKEVSITDFPSSEKQVGEKLLLLLGYASGSVEVWAVSTSRAVLNPSADPTSHRLSSRLNVNATLISHFKGSELFNPLSNVEWFALDSLIVNREQSVPNQRTVSAVCVAKSGAASIISIAREESILPPQTDQGKYYVRKVSLLDGSLGRIYASSTCSSSSDTYSLFALTTESHTYLIRTSVISEAEIVFMWELEDRNSEKASLQNQCSVLTCYLAEQHLLVRYTGALKLEFLGINCEENDLNFESRPSLALDSGSCDLHKCLSSSNEESKLKSIALDDLCTLSKVRFEPEQGSSKHLALIVPSDSRGTPQILNLLLRIVDQKNHKSVLLVFLDVSTRKVIDVVSEEFENAEDHTHKKFASGVFDTIVTWHNQSFAAIGVCDWNERAIYLANEGPFNEFFAFVANRSSTISYQQAVGSKPKALFTNLALTVTNKFLDTCGKDENTMKLDEFLDCLMAIFKTHIDDQVLFTTLFAEFQRSPIPIFTAYLEKAEHVFQKLLARADPSVMAPDILAHYLERLPEHGDDNGDAIGLIRLVVEHLDTFLAVQNSHKQVPDAERLYDSLRCACEKYSLWNELVVFQRALDACNETAMASLCMEALLKATNLENEEKGQLVSESILMPLKRLGNATQQVLEDELSLICSTLLSVLCMPDAVVSSNAKCSILFHVLIDLEAAAAQIYGQHALLLRSGLNGVLQEEFLNYVTTRIKKAVSYGSSFEAEALVLHRVSFDELFSKPSRALIQTLGQTSSCLVSGTEGTIGDTGSDALVHWITFVYRAFLLVLEAESVRDLSQALSKMLVSFCDLHQETKENAIIANADAFDLFSPLGFLLPIASLTLGRKFVDWNKIINEIGSSKLHTFLQVAGDDASSISELEKYVRVSNWLKKIDVKDLVGGLMKRDSFMGRIQPAFLDNVSLCWGISSPMTYLFCVEFELYKPLKNFISEQSLEDDASRKMLQQAWTSLRDLRYYVLLSELFSTRFSIENDSMRSMVLELLQLCAANKEVSTCYGLLKKVIDELDAEAEAGDDRFFEELYSFIQVSELELGSGGFKTMARVCLLAKKYGACIELVLLKLSRLRSDLQADDETQAKDVIDICTLLQSVDSIAPIRDSVRDKVLPELLRLPLACSSLLQAQEYVTKFCNGLSLNEFQSLLANTEADQAENSILEANARFFLLARIETSKRAVVTQKEAEQRIRHQLANLEVQKIKELEEALVITISASPM